MREERSLGTCGGGHAPGGMSPGVENTRPSGAGSRQGAAARDRGIGMKSSGLLFVLLVLLVQGGAFARTSLVLESWREDDRTIWEEKLIPAFEAAHPEIEVRFRPTAPADYDAALNARLEAGAAGDLITCRPFDASLALYEAGRLADLDDLPGMAGFSSAAKSAWQTDDGSATFCVPVASVIHGFLYNRDAFGKTRSGSTRNGKPRFSRSLKESGKTAGGSRWPWASATDGKPRPWATTISGRPTGRARKAVAPWSPAGRS